MYKISFKEYYGQLNIIKFNRDLPFGGTWLQGKVTNEINHKYLKLQMAENPATNELNENSSYQAQHDSVLLLFLWTTQTA